MLILHGENLVQSRQALLAESAHLKDHGQSLKTVLAKELSLSSLEAVLFTESLFAEPRTVIIEELHSLPKSAKRDQFFQLIIEQASNFSTNLILWEKKTLSATDLKKFPNAAIKAFPASKAMFGWLDSWSGKLSETQAAHQLHLLDQAVRQDGAEFCFTMAAWKVRQLLEAKTGHTANGKPANPRAVNQARSFTEAQLWKLHAKLTEVDLHNKTSQGMLALPSQLALLVAER